MMYIRLYAAVLVVLVGCNVRSSAQDPAPQLNPTVPSIEPAADHNPSAAQPDPQIPPIAPAAKQFGGGFGADFGGYGFGAASSFGPGPGTEGDPSKARYVASGAIIVTWSEKYDTVWGFSKTTGRWSRQELDPPATEPPSLDEGLAVFRAGSTLYAYSGQTGRWDVLRLPEDHKPQFAIHGDFVLVHDGSDIYTFADATGRWTSPQGESADEGGGQQTGAIGPGATGPGAMGGGAMGGFLFGAGFDGLNSPPPSSASQLRRTYEELDSAAAKLAQEYRAASATKGPQHPDLVRLKQQVAAAVTQAFQARQQLHQTELAEFQRRMQDVQRTIQARERIQNEIIQRRVNELLDPSVQWEGANESGVVPGVGMSGPSAPPVASSPLGIGGGAPAPEGMPLLSGFATAGSISADRRPARELGQLPELGQRDNVGVVSEATDPERIVVSSAELGGIRPGEELLVIRDNSFNGTQLVGRIEIVQADDETAIGRVLVTRRVLVENRYQPDRVSPGDQVARVRQADVLEPPRDAARETSANNLKQLLLAMHQYHNTYNRFPPAVTLGKDGQGGPPHSWRVALLPFMGEHALYNEYRFHEPWDSEHNRTLLAKMPAVYRSPLDKPDSSHASYFALVTPGFTPDQHGALFGIHGGSGAAPVLTDIPSIGPQPLGAADLAGDALAGETGPPAEAVLEPSWHRGTMYSRPEGIRMADIIDGTSNTVALVEAKRNIPWTQPHDIAYAADQSLPVLGGWFPEGWHAGFADGSAKFISADNDEATIRALFTIGGGEPLAPELVK
jgi:hypothetical protein